MGAVGVSDDHGALRTDNLRRAVPATPDRLCFVKFNHLAVIDICAEGPLGRLNVRCEGIRLELNPVRQSLGKVRYECRRGREIALSDAICRNDLRLGIEGNEGILIADAARIVERRHVALLLPDIRPNLVNLNPPTGKLAHLLVHELCAGVSHLD
jgi:hypothetical protein